MPESPEALIGRASLIWQADKTRAFAVARDLAAGLSQSLRGRETGFRLTSNLLLSLLITWLAALCLVAAILSVKTQPLFGHDLNERILKTLPPPSQASLGLLLFLLPLMLGLGLLWAAVVALLISAPYIPRREQGAVSVLLAMLMAMPFGYEWVAARYLLASSPRFAVAQAVEQGDAAKPSCKSYAAGPRRRRTLACHGTTSAWCSSGAESLPRPRQRWPRPPSSSRGRGSCK